MIGIFDFTKMASCLILKCLLQMGRHSEYKKHTRSHKHRHSKHERHLKRRSHTDSPDDQPIKREHADAPQVKIEHRNSPDPQANGPPFNKEQSLNKEQPCFEPSGILLKFYNSRDGVSLKFHEPPEGRAPIDGWRLYIFKDDEVLNPILLSSSVYLVGKDERVADILCQNPSISRQHAVIQFRLIHKRDVEWIEVIKPYVMDLESTNGTLLNGEKIEASRYVELLHRDILKFGLSDREYVIMKDELCE